jgi:hypothetical protein
VTADRVAQIERAVTDTDVKCWRCGRKIAALLTRPWSLRCRCGAQNSSPPEWVQDQPSNVHQ